MEQFDKQTANKLREQYQNSKQEKSAEKVNTLGMIGERIGTGTAQNIQKWNREIKPTFNIPENPTMYAEYIRTKCSDYLQGVFVPSIPRLEKLIELCREKLEIIAGAEQELREERDRYADAKDRATEQYVEIIEDCISFAQTQKPVYERLIALAEEAKAKEIVHPSEIRIAEDHKAILEHMQIRLDAISHFVLSLKGSVSKELGKIVASHKSYEEAIDVIRKHLDWHINSIEEIKEDIGREIDGILEYGDQIGEYKEKLIELENRAIDESENLEEIDIELSRFEQNLK